MKYIPLVFIVFILGCSSQPVANQLTNELLEKVFEKATNTQVGDNAASCHHVRRTCTSGNYQEWHQKNGKVACACNG